MKIKLDIDIADYSKPILGKFGFKEVIAFIAIIVLGSAGILLMYFGLGLSINISIYCNIPVILIIGTLGFYDKQGMSIVEKLKRQHRMNHTIIPYVSTENPKEYQAAATLQEKGKQESCFKLFLRPEMIAAAVLLVLAVIFLLVKGK